MVGVGGMVDLLFGVIIIYLKGNNVCYLVMIC